MLKNARVDPTIEQPEAWSAEPREAALERSPDIGRAFFERLAQVHPEVSDRLLFFRWRVQWDDVYAVYDSEPGFGVQIDPDNEYVIVWDGVSQGEYAEWHPGDDPVADALAHISRSLGVGRAAPSADPPST